MNFERDCPMIPDEIVADMDSLPQYFFDVCGSMWTDVLTEMLDADYRNRSHHNVSTYDSGCRGPLCRKAHREHPRRKAPVSVNLREERVYDPVIEYFHVVVKHRIRTAQQELLKELA